MSVDRLIGGLFLFACLLLWFWIIPQQVVGEEQAFYPRLTVILVAIPAALMFLRNKGRRITLAFSGKVPTSRRTLPSRSWYLS